MGSSCETSLKSAAGARAVPPGVPYFWTIILCLARAHFNSASSEAVQDDKMWSRLPHALRLLGRPRPLRPPRET
jgi:hypothetical protein